MKKNTLLFVFLFLSLLSYSQDKIFLRSGDTLVAKILTVTDDIVTYKLFNYQDGPSFTVSKEKISKITYANGTVDNFNKAELLYGRNIIAFNPLEIISGNLSFSYERLNKKQKFGFRTAFFFPVYYTRYNKSGLNFDFKFYVGVQNKVQYYAGLSVVGYKGNYHSSVGLMFINGLTVQLHKFYLSFDGGIGGGYTDYNYVIFPINSILWRAALNVGWRF
ncbi:hypothetical protein BH11BAC7_BH11BAC7_19430 [soil metagenome]